MTIKLNSDNTVAIDQDYYWRDMATCPRGVKVQLRGVHGVAIYGIYRGGTDFYTHWAPLPTLKKEK